MTDAQAHQPERLPKLIKQRMQTACYWQLLFSDRFTGARNPTRLHTTIQSRRNRCAPIFEEFDIILAVFTMLVTGVNSTLHPILLKCFN
jgi:hypothetical protein